MDKLTAADRAWAQSIAAAHPLDGRAARASGNHLTAQNDEPEPPLFSEAELLAGDVQRSVDKAQRFHRRDDAIALDLDVAAMHRLGWL